MFPRRLYYDRGGGADSVVHNTNSFLAFSAESPSAQRQTSLSQFGDDVHTNFNVVKECSLVLTGG
tara:strand:- start:375 stop:569 length:195 start_codon:yes stop_codon:yes gene_type:complete